MKSRKLFVLHLAIVLLLLSASPVVACGGDGELKCSGDPPCNLWRTINPNYPDYCIACGNVGQLQCPDGSGSPPCRPEYEAAANGTCVTSCGGDGELKCSGESPCDVWRTVNLNYPDYCIACGGDGYFKCTGENTPYTCREWRTVNTLYPDYCIACGGLNQHACDYSLASPTLCRDGNIVSISGTCEPCGGIGQPACADNGTTNTEEITVPKQTPGKPLWGYVDAHEHQFANDAYGGAMFWGKPFAAGGINKALASCDYTSDFQTKPPTFNPLYVPFLVDFSELGANLNGGYPVHGSKLPTLADPIPTQPLYGYTLNMATAEYFYDDGLGSLLPYMHHVNGADNFYLNTADPDKDRGWPHHLDGGHQQMYYKWLERAYQGGMRLLVNMPVNNEVLCKLSIQREGYTCDDMDAAYIQIDDIKALERYVDLEDDGIINHSGWYRIAFSPQQARNIIQDGDLAVIISIEVDSLFGCKPGTENSFCTPEYIDEQLDKLYNAGVRHVFPVHLFDNTFSGAAYYSDIFSVANSFATGDVFQPDDCINDEEAYSYRFKTEYSLLNLLFSPLATLYGANGSDIVNSFITLDPNRGADCNSKGLSPRGLHLLNSLMAKGVLIDIDHFSHLALESVLDVFDDENNPYPPVSSHTVVVPDAALYLSPEYYAEGNRAELAYSRKLAKRILKMGGHIAINPSRPNHFEGWERGTTEQFVNGIPRQYVNGLPYHQKRTLGYNDIMALVQEAYLENNMNLTPGDEKWLDPQYPHIGFVGDFGAFVNQPEPRFSAEAGYYEYKCLPDTLAENLLTHENCTINVVSDDGGLVYTKVNCPSAVLDQLLPQRCLVKAEDDGSISLDLHPPLTYPFEGFEPVDKNNLDGPRIGKFYKSQTGPRTFDFNTDGLAHVGMFPDMLADARNNYGADLEPFFNSAEAFVRLWERVYMPDPNAADTDGDGVGDDMDACAGYDDNLNADGDTVPDDCDICPNDPDNDYDNDTLCADVDNCPMVANIDQADYDQDSVGDACDPDMDGDGVANENDLCELTPPEEVVEPEMGCSIDQLVPCEGPKDTNESWKNHGKYVSMLARKAESFMYQGLITETEKDTMIAVAAKSDCCTK